MVWKQYFSVNNKLVSQYQDYNCSIHLVTLENDKTYIKFYCDTSNYLGMKLIPIRFDGKNVKTSRMFYNSYALIKHIMTHEILVENIGVIKYFNKYVYNKVLEKELSKEYMAETL